MDGWMIGCTTTQPLEPLRELLKRRIDVAWAAAAVQQGVAAAKAGEMSEMSEVG